MSLLDFLRKSGNNGQISQKYRRMHKHHKIGMPLNDWINVHPPDGKTLVANVMYAHTNDRHYGQWLLLNVPFQNVDDLWVEDAKKLPENLKFLGLCVLHRRRFWRDPQRIRAELEKEARSETYIQNTLAMLAARIELIDAYLSGEMTVEKEPEPALDGVAKVAGTNIKVAPEQAKIIQTIRRRVRHALLAKWPEDNQVESWATWLEQEEKANTPTVVLGPAGSGKSTAVEIALAEAVQAGAHVGVACPTGMLATRYRSRHPDLDIDTVHGMFALHKDELSTADIMKIYDLIIIDEIGQVPVWIFDAKTRHRVRRRLLSTGGRRRRHGKRQSEMAAHERLHAVRNATVQVCQIEVEAATAAELHTKRSTVEEARQGPSCESSRRPHSRQHRDRRRRGPSVQGDAEHHLRHHLPARDRQGEPARGALSLL